MLLEPPALDGVTVPRPDDDWPPLADGCPRSSEGAAGFARPIGDTSFLLRRPIPPGPLKRAVRLPVFARFSRSSRMLAEGLAGKWFTPRLSGFFAAAEGTSAFTFASSFSIFLLFNFDIA